MIDTDAAGGPAGVCSPPGADAVSRRAWVCPRLPHPHTLTPSMLRANFRQVDEARINWAERRAERAAQIRGRGGAGLGRGRGARGRDAPTPGGDPEFGPGARGRGGAGGRGASAGDAGAPRGREGGPPPPEPRGGRGRGQRLQVPGHRGELGVDDIRRSARSVGRGKRGTVSAQPPCSTRSVCAEISCARRFPRAHHRRGLQVPPRRRRAWIGCVSTCCASVWIALAAVEPPATRSELYVCASEWPFILQIRGEILALQGKSSILTHTYSSLGVGEERKAAAPRTAWILSHRMC